MGSTARYVQVLELLYFEGLSGEEIGKKTNLNRERFAYSFFELRRSSAKTSGFRMLWERGNDHRHGTCGDWRNGRGSGRGSLGRVSI